MAGLKTAFTRQPSQTTSSYLLQKIGMSQRNADFADGLIGALGSMGGIRLYKVGPLLLASPSRLKGPIRNGVRNINHNGVTSAAESIAPKIVFQERKFTVEKLLEAGKAIDRQGLTKAGRGLAKHGGRENSVFLKPLGNPEQINLQGQQILEKILLDSEKKVIFDQSMRFGEFVDIFSPGYGGVRFTQNGEFITFLEP